MSHDRCNSSYREDPLDSFSWGGRLRMGVMAAQSESRASVSTFSLHSQTARSRNSQNLASRVPAISITRMRHGAQPPTPRPGRDNALRPLRLLAADCAGCRTGTPHTTDTHATRSAPHKRQERERQGTHRHASQSATRARRRHSPGRGHDRVLTTCKRIHNESPHYRSPPNQRS